MSVEQDARWYADRVIDKLVDETGLSDDYGSANDADIIQIREALEAAYVAGWEEARAQPADQRADGAIRLGL